MAKKYGNSISDQDISLAMNSALARSQNQLHIHISCIRPDVRMQINQHQGAVKTTWAKFPGTLVGHTYYARRLSVNDFKNKNVFMMVSDGLPEAKKNIQQYGVAVVPLMRKNKTRGFILLAEKADEASQNLGSAEEIQDHDCPQLPLKAN
jgi:CDP-diacylglycerol pyrophosphatase